MMLKPGGACFLLQYSLGMSQPNPIDQKILRQAAYKSPAEISADLGNTLSPEEVASRAIELLESLDWLTVLQRKKLLLVRLEALLDRYWDWAMEGSVKSAQSVVIPAIQEIRKFVEKDSNDLEEAMLKINDVHAERMGMALAKGFQAILDRSGVDEKEAEVIVLEVMPLAMAEIDEARAS